MRTRRLILPAIPLVIGSVVLAGCAVTATPTGMTEDTTTTGTTISASTAVSAEAILAENENATVVRDDEWSDADAVDITLTGDGAETTGSAVTVDGATVTIGEAGVYRLSGSLEGSVIVSAADDAQVVLILDGVDITNADGAAVNVASADDVAISLADGSTNTLSDASSYAEDADRERGAVQRRRPHHHRNRQPDCRGQRQRRHHQHRRPRDPVGHGLRHRGRRRDSR